LAGDLSKLSTPSPDSKPAHRSRSTPISRQSAVNSFDRCIRRPGSHQTARSPDPPRHPPQPPPTILRRSWGRFSRSASHSRRRHPAADLHDRLGGPSVPPAHGAQPRPPGRHAPSYEAGVAPALGSWRRRWPAPPPPPPLPGGSAPGLPLHAVAARSPPRGSGGIVQLRRFPFSPAPLRPPTPSSPFVCGFQQGGGGEGDTARASLCLHVALYAGQQPCRLIPPDECRQSAAPPQGFRRAPPRGGQALRGPDSLPASGDGHPPVGCSPQPVVRALSADTDHRSTRSGWSLPASGRRHRPHKRLARSVSRCAVKGRPPAALRPRATRFTHPAGRETAPGEPTAPGTKPAMNARAMLALPRESPVFCVFWRVGSIIRPCEQP